MELLKSQIVESSSIEDLKMVGSLAGITDMYSIGGVETINIEPQYETASKPNRAGITAETTQPNKPKVLLNVNSDTELPLSPT